MAALTTAEKAPLIVDGDPLTSWDGIVSDDTDVVFIQNIAGVAYAVSGMAGIATVTVTKNGNSGSVEITVTEAPLDVTLGTPEPK